MMKFGSICAVDKQALGGGKHTSIAGVKVFKFRAHDVVDYEDNVLVLNSSFDSFMLSKFFDVSERTPASSHFHPCPPNCASFIST